jgi:hypothetical protein
MAKLISEKFDDYAKEPSQVYSVRVRVDDLATITEFMIRNGVVPISSGKIASDAVKMAAQSIIASGKGRVFGVQEAKVYLERLGLRVPGSKRNQRVMGCQFEPIAPREHDPALLQEIQRIMREREQTEVSDYTIPPEAEQVLAELESGKPPIENE